MNIEESNELIARFMTDDNGYLSYPGGTIGNWIWNKSENEITNFINTLFYHLSWDWLMPVGRKITTEFPEYDETDHMVSVLDTICSFNIEDVYKVIVEFIKWYNEEQLKT